MLFCADVTVVDSEEIAMLVEVLTRYAATNRVIVIVGGTVQDDTTFGSNVSQHQRWKER
jgi:hypothetical protein